VGLISKFMPARAEAEDGVELIADIDAIIEKTLSFKFMGRIHKLKSLDLENFMVWSNAWASMFELKNKETTEEETLQKYHEVIASMCDTITIDDLKKAEQPQIAALFGLVIDHALGKDRAKEFEKKKTMTATLT